MANRGRKKTEFAPEMCIWVVKNLCTINQSDPRQIIILRIHENATCLLGKWRIPQKIVPIANLWNTQAIKIPRSKRDEHIRLGYSIGFWSSRNFFGHLGAKQLIFFTWNFGNCLYRSSLTLKKIPDEKFSSAQFWKLES